MDELVLDSSEPPFTDRGVVNTEVCINTGENANSSKNLKTIDMLFDWMQFTIQGHLIDDVLYNLFKTIPTACLHTPSGRFGYNNTYTFGEKIHVMWHDVRADMGVHVLLSGSACRELEELLGWEIFIGRIFFHQVVKFTRIDIAIDCYKRYFDVLQLRQKISDGELVSKFRQSTFMEQLNVSDGKQQSASLKFGSMSSNLYIVFYDKLSERKNAGYTIDNDIDFWVRCELRFKSDLANHIIQLYVLENYRLGTYVQEILYNYIDFKEYDSYQKNKSRWDTSPFWLDFIGVVDKMSIAPKAQQSTIQRKQKYADMQFSKMAVMLSVVDNDFYKNLLEIGHKKVSKQDLEIINAHRISQNESPFTMSDITDIYRALVTQKGSNETRSMGYSELQQLQMEGIL